MKQFFTFIFLLSFSNYLQAQCSELFISEYIEGWANNKAIEIYNPTSDTVDLSGYTLSRYANGSIEPSSTQLSGTIEPFSAFVVGIDKQDPSGEGYEAPMWDGWITDSITNELTYFPETDLQSRIDLFINPVYYSGNNADSALANPNTMYFNGNDAVALKAIDGFLPADIIGRIGEDPGAAWTDGDGNYWTKDHTLIRKSNINGGVSFNPSVFNPTVEWDSLPPNTFVNLGSHECECNPNNNLVEEKNTFVIYPNPTSNSKITISNSLDIKSIALYNNLGQLMLNQDIDNLKQTNINLPNKQGFYFIALKDSKGIKTKSVLLK